MESQYKVGVALSYHSQYDEAWKRLNTAVPIIMGAKEGKPYDRGDRLSLLSGRGSQLLIIARLSWSVLAASRELTPRSGGQGGSRRCLHTGESKGRGLAEFTEPLHVKFMRAR